MRVFNNTVSSFILFLLCACSHTLNAEDDHFVTLELNLQGLKYDKLTLEVTRYISNMQDNRLCMIEGEQVEDYLWKFEIPDSVNQSSRYCKLKYKPFDFTTNTDFSIKFMSVIENDTLFSDWFIYDKNMNPIEASLFTKNKEERPSYIVGDSLYVHEATIISDVFYINHDNYKNTELEAIMKSTTFGIYNSMEDEEQYKKDLTNSINLASKYPYSKYLLAELTHFRASYNNSEDLNRVYEKFTNTQDEDTEFFTDIILNYLKFNPHDFSFENIKLKNSTTGIEEFVIDAPEKHSLIVFTASWCGPCHERIPLLKKIFSEKGDELNIIYISIDNYSTIKDWKSLLITKSIPWRSLSLLEDEFDIIEKYQLRGVPYMMFIHSGGRGEIIDLHTQQDKEELYKRLFD